MIKRKNLGQIFSYDIFRAQTKICEAWLLVAPSVTQSTAYTVDLRLHFTTHATGDGGEEEYFYNIDKQSITASQADIVQKCDRLFLALCKDRRFWQHIDAFLEGVGA